MTISEAYAYLGQIRGITRRIEKVDERLSEMRYSLLPSAIRYDKDRVQSSPKDALLETMAKIDDLERRRAVLVDVKDRLIAADMEQILKIPMSKERTFLLRYYIHCQSINEVADALNITTRHCFRIKANAVSMFVEVVNHG